NRGSRADQILRNLVKVNKLFLGVISNVQLPESLWNPDAEGYVYLGPTQTLDPPRAGLIDGVLEEVTGVALVVSLVTGYFTDPEIKVYIDKKLDDFEFKKAVDDFVEKRKNHYENGTTAEIQHQSGKDLVSVASILAGVGAAIKVIKKGVTFTKELTTSVKRWGNAVGKYANDFFSTTGIKITKATDDGILAGAKKWQGKGDYPGVDDWEVYEIPAGSKIYGGIPGQTGFYSTFDNLQNVNFDKIKYWESLQVKPDDILGFRPKVAEYTTKETIKVAISKTLANSQFGKGGGWQVFVDDFANKLELVKEIPLK
ncbi:hypothetical protein N8Z33_03145, partial [Flavobacteriaceae bacterium]|nr:hypothetical protein [Flavobacteriaceae bacterium]